ncbi:hypothetical protein Droror1_Dr00013963 [Drosera rotundifolia]
MAAVAVAQFTRSTLLSPILSPIRPRRKIASKPRATVTCVSRSYEPNRPWQSRRSVSISLVFLQSLFYFPLDAVAGGPFDKYIKRKKLDPLESYLPAVVLTQFQIKDLEKNLEIDNPQYAACRNLLRSGAAASFRANIRAVAQYASDDGKGKAAFEDVDQCLRALEELDSLLLHASRNDPQASVKLMKGQIGVALNALDSLLQTVPAELLDKGKAIADAYRAPEDDTQLDGNLDPELKQLESIL